jgi:tetratricopeptide (TPR) repeat protein
VRALVVAVIAASATPAFADIRGLAREEFALGEAADEQRDWRTALEHYLRANDLVSHENAIFNIAREYERLGELRKAARWYERYLEAAPDPPDRERVVAILARLKETTSTREPASSSIPSLRVGYLLGGGAGADLRSGRGINAAEVGAGEYGFELTARVGKAVDLTSLELVLRWPLLGTRRLTPTLALGYAYVFGTDAASNATEVGAGYEAVGGIRFAIYRRDRVAVLAGAETGVRYHAVSSRQMIVPVLASVLLEYR